MSEKMAAMSEAEMVKLNSGAMKRLERIWDEVVSRMGEKMADDGLCAYSHGAAEAEKLRARLTILHREMDQFAATYGNVAIARTGER